MIDKNQDGTVYVQMFFDEKRYFSSLFFNENDNC